MNHGLAEAVLFENVLDQSRIDRLLKEADGSENKERLGANAIWLYPLRRPGRRPAP